MKALTTEGMFIGISQKEIPYVTDMAKRLHVCCLSPSPSRLIPAQAGSASSQPRLAADYRVAAACPEGEESQGKAPWEHGRDGEHWEILQSEFRNF